MRRFARGFPVRGEDPESLRMQSSSERGRKGQEPVNQQMLMSGNHIKFLCKNNGLHTFT
jgi:hypothetical protein